MKKYNNQLTGSTDVRNNKKVSRLRMALMGTGVSSALLMGSLLGVTGLAHAAPTNLAAHQSAHTVQVSTAPLAYNMSDNYVSMAREAAIKAGISPDLFVRQIRQESGFNPRAISPAGAIGIAQFMPATAAAMGVNPYDPVSSLYGGARLMAQLNRQFGGNYAMALAAYNGGPGAVQRAIRMGGGNWMAYLPTESRNYVHIIMGW